MKRVTMRSPPVRFGSWLAAAVVVAAALNASTAAAAPVAPATAVLARQPVLFEANRGQADPGVLFLTTGPGSRVYLTATGAIVDLRTTRHLGRKLPQSSTGMALRRGQAAKREGPVIEMRFVGADPLAPVVTGEAQRPRVNYLQGRDRSTWVTDVPTYDQIRYKEIYSGIDLVYHARPGRQIEYDFIVAPNADPRRIALQFSGIDRVDIAPDGDLVVRAGGRDIRHRKPFVYQEIGGTRIPVPGRYIVKGPGLIGFDIPTYVAAQALVIDPVFDVSAAGGLGTGSAVDAAGNTVFVGIAEGGFVGANPALYGGGIDVFVAKLDSAYSLLWATYLGGEGHEFANSVALDAAGNIYVTGDTRSFAFPATSGTYQGGTCLVVVFHVPCPDAFIVKLTSAGSLAYATIIGGTGTVTPSIVGLDFGQSIAVDTAGNAYLAGGSAPNTTAPLATYFGTPLVGTSGPLGGESDIFVAKVDPAGTVVWLRVIGGSGSDNANGIAVDTAGNVILTGDTYGTGLAPGDNDLGPMTPDAAQTIYGGGVSDAFVLKLAPAGAVLYLSFLGGSSDDFGMGIAAGSMLITGATYSDDFLITANAVQTTLSPPPCSLATDPDCAQTADAYIVKFPDPTGGTTPLQPVFSTFLGGPGEDSGSGIAVSSSGEVYISGITSSTSFPASISPTEQPAGFIDVTVGQDVFSVPQVFVTKMILPAAATEPAVVVYTAPTNAGAVGNSVPITVSSAGDVVLAGAATGGDAGSGGVGVVLPDPRQYARLDVQPTIQPDKTGVTKGRGTIPVVILSSTTFDPTKIDIATLRFGRVGAETAPVRCDPPTDKNKDHKKDLTCHFDAGASGFVASDVLARATGTLVGGAEFLATGPIRTAPVAGAPKIK